jgi:hypothetical protein
MTKNPKTYTLVSTKLSEISQDEYIVQHCSILNNECCWYPANCQTCDTAAKYLKQELLSEKQAEINNYTVFARVSEINGLPVRINNYNVIAKTDHTTVEQLQRDKIVSFTPKPYHPDYLKQYPALRKLRHYNNLGIPDELWADKDKPGVFRWGDTYYLIAPKVADT